MPVAASSNFDVDRLRATEFPGVAGGIYLNAAAVTPLPERTRRAVEASNLSRSRIHTLSDPELLAGLDRSRAAAARLIGAEVEEIALGWNTSFGINVAALSLPAPSGSTVLVSAGEFPTNVYPWMERERLRLEIMPRDDRGWPDEARLLERLERGDVGIFALSCVQFASGYRADVEKFGALCRERGIFFVVDAIQSLGQIPLDVRAAKIDVLATGAHKWLCAPFGTGFAYVRRELLERMEPRMVGWTGMESCADLESLLDYRWEPRADARRFETGTLPFQDFAGFAESLELILETGVETIEEHIREILTPIHDWVAASDEVEAASATDDAHRSGIFCFRPPHVERVHAALTASGVSCVVREGAIRLAAHFYNTRSEVERVVELLEESRRAGWS
jgi:selenocysteine lyase/cysteine desulfurase